MTTSLTITRLTITRPVFRGASLSFSALEAAWIAAPYGDAFVALAAEWQMRVEWEAARIASAAGAGSAGGNSASGQNFQLTHNRTSSLIACK